MTGLNLAAAITLLLTACGGTEAQYSMPSLAYHETIPGHHLQLGLQQESNLPYFTAFVKAAVGTAAHLAQPVDRRLYLPVAQGQN